MLAVAEVNDVRHGASHLDIVSRINRDRRTVKYAEIENVHVTKVKQVEL